MPTTLHMYQSLEGDKIVDWGFVLVGTAAKELKAAPPDMFRTMWADSDRVRAQLGESPQTSVLLKDVDP